MEVSISFGRFEKDTLSWEKWSFFSTNKHLEEIVRLSTPGSVARKAAYFDAHYKRIAAARKAKELELAKEMEKEKSRVGESRKCDQIRDSSRNIDVGFGFSDGDRSFNGVANEAKGRSFGSRGLGIEQKARDDSGKNVVNKRLTSKKTVEKVLGRSALLKIENSNSNARNMDQKAFPKASGRNSVKAEKKVVSRALPMSTHRLATTTSTTLSNSKPLKNNVAPTLRERGSTMVEKKVVQRATPMSTLRHGMTTSSTLSPSKQLKNKVCGPPLPKSNNFFKRESTDSNGRCSSQKVTPKKELQTLTVTKKKVGKHGVPVFYPILTKSTLTSTSSTEPSRKKVHKPPMPKPYNFLGRETESTGRHANQKAKAPMKKEEQFSVTKKKVVPPAVLVFCPDHAKPSPTLTTLTTTQPLRKRVHGAPLPKTNNFLKIETKSTTNRGSLSKPPSLGLTKSSPSRNIYRKSSKTGDKDIVKRTFKTLNDRANGPSSMTKIPITPKKINL